MLKELPIFCTQENTKDPFISLRDDNTRMA
jgi:hypothetical protein